MIKFQRWMESWGEREVYYCCRFLTISQLGDDKVKFLNAVDAG